MTEFTEKKENFFKRFIKKIGKFFTTNIVYKVMTVITAVIIWLVVTFAI